MSYDPNQPRDPKGTATGGQWTGGSGGGSGASSSTGGETIPQEPRTGPRPKGTKAFDPDVERDLDGDGVTDAARVGVPAHEVPPPPVVPRLPNLTPQEREVETAFAEAYQGDPEGMARRYIEMAQAGRKPGEPVTFESDAAKNLFEPWAGRDLSLDERAQFRATMNTPLHQTANAITKKAFLQHLDSMSDEEKAKGLLVTVGGVGAGKGFALKTLGGQVPEADKMKYGVVWDSAGDQNATENPWLLAEASRRGIPVTYVYVSSDPKTSWADPKRGVVQRARNNQDGRMVDAHVFADSYVLGARNHDNFSRKNAGKAKFVYVENGEKVRTVSGVPKSDLSRSRKDLLDFATDTVTRQSDLEPRIRRGALTGRRIWEARG